MQQGNRRASSKSSDLHQKRPHRPYPRTGHKPYTRVKVCQLLAVGRWFPPGTLVSSISDTDISSSSSP